MHPLFHHINSVISLNEKDFQKILHAGRLRSIKKNQLLLEQGDICDSDFFVLDGAIKQCHYSANGQEQIVQFAFANWWVSDWYSILNKTPSVFSIEALASSNVLQFRYSDLDELLEEIPAFEKYFRIIFQKSFAVQQKRILWMQKPAAERYADFLESYRYFEQLLPQAQVASYLGLTRESLNRLKNQR